MIATNTPTIQHDLDPVLTVKQFRDLLGMTTRHFRRMRDMEVIPEPDGYLPGTKSARWRKSTVQRFLSDCVGTK